eukprot:TRINITY_DN20889_c0_g1_i1.p1 TRINITY_DN20889_c0_g1~~TRINITY_DN20889_c0_g1_i1.p1  ORF type:complete len:591 (-),score=123.00 TRINITY_DN20889_c0_g1_i1:40-1812(-)
MMATLLPTTRNVDSAQIEGVVQQLEVARRYTIKLSEIIQEQGRDLDNQAAALEAAASQTQQDKQLISQLQLKFEGAPGANSDHTRHNSDHTRAVDQEELSQLRRVVQELQDAAVREQQQAQQTAVELMQLTLENQTLLDASAAISVDPSSDLVTTKDELLQLRAAYEELRQELRKALLDRVELEQAPSPAAELSLEVEELSRRLEDSQQERARVQSIADDHGAQVMKLRQVAETMQEHNTRMLEQLNANSTQMQAILQSKTTEANTIEAAHQREVSGLQAEILAQRSLCEQLREELHKAGQDNDAVRAEGQERNMQLVVGLREALTDQENKHNQQLEILAREKTQARKVVNDCLHLSTERDKEVATLKQELRSAKSWISLHQKECHTIEERHKHEVESMQSELEQQRREKLLLERQLLEITKSADYYARNQIPARESFSEVTHLRSQVQELTTKNKQLHEHATLKSQESEILQASLNLLSQHQGGLVTPLVLNEVPRPQHIAEAMSPANDAKQGARESLMEASGGPMTQPNSSTHTHAWRHERRNLDEENDAIKMRIVELVDRHAGLQVTSPLSSCRLEGQLHSPQKLPS